MRDVSVKQYHVVLWLGSSRDLELWLAVPAMCSVKQQGGL